jgi:hypothetical protein
MVLEIREVSRKTARDGRLEVITENARRLRMLRAPFAVEVDGTRGIGTLVEMSCHCGAAGTEGSHTHHFVESSLFRALPAGETVVMELLDGDIIAVARPHPLRP